MGRTLGTLGALALTLACAGLAACGNGEGVTLTPLGFTIVEGLLVTNENDATAAQVILASNPGNCPFFQTGVGPWQIAESDFLTFTLQAQDAHTTAGGGFLPLTAGTYNIVMQFTAGAGLFASSTEYETDGNCNYPATGANSGTLTIDPFNSDAGATSGSSYSVVFGLNEFEGSFALTTCVVPATAVYDAGTCATPTEVL
jgi:hypothetical protein